MNDDNNLNIQRRNLMIINIIVLIYSVTSNTINEFKIIGMEFKLNQNFDLNYIFIITWIYFLFRYISTLSFKIHKKEIILKEEQLSLKDVKYFTRVRRDAKDIILHSMELIKTIPYLLFNKVFFDYFIPIFFAFFSIYFLLTNKLQVSSSTTFSSTIGLLCLVYLFMFIIISLIPDFAIKSSRNFKVKKTENFYEKKCKSKLRKENLKNGTNL